MTETVVEAANMGDSAPRQEGLLKLAEVKKLIKQAGKKPTLDQINAIEATIISAPNKYQIIFQILSEAELSLSGPNALVALRAKLLPVILASLSAPPPAVESREGVIQWLRAELDSLAGEPSSGERTRAILLWLLCQRRNPDLFIMCCVELSNSRKESSTQKSKRSGFAFQNIAKKMVMVGGSKQPRLQNLLESFAQISAMQTYLQQKLCSAEEAVKELAIKEQCLARAKQKVADLEAINANLEAEKTQLESSLAQTQSIASEWEKKHKEALEHSGAESGQALKSVLTNFKFKIEPRLADALLYLNRPTPAVDQIRRLITEIQASLEVDV